MLGRTNIQSWYSFLSKKSWYSFYFILYFEK